MKNYNEFSTLNKTEEALARRLIQDEYEGIKAIIGDIAFEKLQEGVLMHVWRRTTPWNIYIEDKNNCYWHSNEDNYYLSPNTMFFKEVYTSSSRLPAYWGSDSRMPELSKYRLYKNVPKSVKIKLLNLYDFFSKRFRKDINLCSKKCYWYNRTDKRCRLYKRQLMDKNRLQECIDDPSHLPINML